MIIRYLHSNVIRETVFRANYVIALISLGLIPRGLPRFLEESLKTDGFHQIKNYLPLNASWACPEDFFTSDIKPITRKERVAVAEATIFALLNERQKEFIEFVLSKYVETGVGELDQSKLPILLANKFQSQEDGIEKLGGNALEIRDMFIEFQKYLYTEHKELNWKGIGHRRNTGIKKMFTLI
ncbi:Type I restriction-modification system, restriction subunit R [hydrothermal vent metagenome]|uniref:Type I restriction-modification system, restriction subunit R n=1 Tax=hydrothermal vent metagenome TaxID=652676 RepID=A0A3B0T166_9ZZZZ